MSVEIILVPAQAVEAMWPQASPHLEPSIAMSRGCFEPVDVLAACAAGGMQLWLAADGNEIIGALVTELRDFPRKRLARVMFAGGKHVRRWYAEADKAIEDWSRAWGCAALSASGRKGWARLIGGEEIAVELWRDLSVAPSSQEIH